MNRKQITCLNGSFVLAHRAAVPVSDRGFRFGDGVFETIRLHEGVPYQWQAHMGRLAQGLAALRIDAPVDWAGYTRRLIEKNKAKEGFIRISVSRGSGSKGYQPHPPGMPITWVIEYSALSALPAEPLKLWVSTTQKISPHALPVQTKLANGLNQTLALFDATDNGCDDAIQLSTDGLLSETSSANIFWVKADTLYTPSLDVGCLNGTTRDAVLRLSPLPTRLVREGVTTLAEAEAVFVTNCRLGAWPVARIEPSGWGYNPHHPFITGIRRLLEADYGRDYEAHRNAWGAR